MSNISSKAKQRSNSLCECKACGWKWFPRTTTAPRICPHCKSASWATGRRRAPRRTAAQIEALEDRLDSEAAARVLANTDPSQWRTLDELRKAIRG